MLALRPDSILSSFLFCHSFFYLFIHPFIHYLSAVLNKSVGNDENDYDNDDDDDDIYIMMQFCLFVTKNEHFLLSVSCNHLNPP